MIYAAFDPGFSGGLAIKANNKHYTYTLPVLTSKKNKVLDCRILSECLVDHCVEKVFIEKVHSAPGQGVVSMFSFGKGLGQLIGMIQTLGLPYEDISPQVWKRHFKLIGADKKASIAKCVQTFPSINLIQKGCRVPHEGIAEALLILTYGIRSTTS